MAGSAHTVTTTLRHRTHEVVMRQLILGAVLATSLTLVSATMQERARVFAIPEAIACTSCRIQFVGSVLLTGAESATPHFSAGVVRSSAGSFYVAPTEIPSVIAEHGPDGRFVREIGRSGSGPGEFRSIERIRVGAADSLIVYDRGSFTLSMLTPDGEYARTVPLQTQLGDWFQLGSQKLAVRSKVLGQPTQRTPVLHIMSAVDGSILKSFAPELPGANGVVSPPTTVRWLAPGPNGTLWSVHQNRYVIEQFDSTGQLLRRFERAPTWFPEYVDFPSDGRSFTRIQAATVDAAGRLWLLFIVPDPRWKPRPSARNEQPRMLTTAEIDERVDSRIEIFDPAQNRIVAAARYARSLNGFADPEHVYLLEQDEQDVYGVRVFRVRIEPQSRGEK